MSASGTAASSSGHTAAAKHQALDPEPAAKAIQAFVHDFGRTAALYMEACVHCGMCAEACHFFEVTKDPKYTPIWKIEPMKQAYKREYGPFAPVYKLFSLKKKVTVEELGRWQELLYDSCTLCGRCSLVCPMGIDITGLIADARHGMAAAGLAPPELQHSPNAPDGVAFEAKLAELSENSGVAIAIGRQKAEVLCTISPVELDHYPTSIIAIARIMNRLGVAWTFRAEGFEASNEGVVSGDMDVQRRCNLRLIEAAIACGARKLVLPECGQAYGALRWMGAELYGAPLPFEVLHISEFLAGEVEGGRLKLKRLKKSAAFHDPCQVTRRGGAQAAAPVLLRALGLNSKNMYPGREANWCCGGGGGVNALPRTEALRHKVVELKMMQIEETAADLALTSCANCRWTFDQSKDHLHWDRSVDSLLELIADNLIEEDA